MTNIVYNVYLSKLFSRCYLFESALKLNKDSIVNRSGVNLFNLGVFDKIEREKRLEDSEIKYVNIVIDINDDYFFKVLALDIDKVRYKLIINMLFSNKSIIVKSVTVNLKNNISAIEFYILSNIPFNKNIDLYINSVDVNNNSVVKLLYLLCDLKYVINILHMDYEVYQLIKSISDNKIKKFVMYNIKKYFILLNKNIKYLRKYFYDDKVILYDTYDNINFLDNNIYLIKQIDVINFGNIKYKKFSDNFTLFGVDIDLYLNKVIDISKYNKFFIYCKNIINNIEYYENFMIIYYNNNIIKLKYNNLNKFIIIDNNKRFLSYNFNVNKMNVNFIQI